MPDMHLHIISFDIPYPANYGGVIDVFYKIKALHASGIKVHLHCFEYHRQPAPELNKYCETVNYYPRKTGFAAALNWKPYIVFGRRSDELLHALCQDDFPIIFEGLHSCYYLSHPLLQNRVRIYRESNIEHHYYFQLSKAEKNFFKKIYFLFSGVKLRAFQKILAYSTLMLTVSREDQEYLKSQFPEKSIEYLPSFHHDDDVNILPGKGDYALYHGNLSVGENFRAAEHLINQVFNGSPVQLIVAGLNPPSGLVKLAGKHENVRLLANPSDDEIFRLIHNAQVNILITIQPTGLKLKLLNALFNGRFCLVNPEMLAGTELENLCEIGNSDEELKQKVVTLMNRSFSEEQIRFRRQHLLKWHSNNENCKTLINFISLLYKPSF
jgi:hypothetical protein